MVEEAILQKLLQLLVSGKVVDAILVLLESGVDIECKDTCGRTPLAQAAAAGRCSMVSILAYDFKANFEAMDQNGFTPVALAAAAGETACVKILIELGADLQCGDNTGTTALMHASASNSVDALNLLLTAPFPTDINAQNNCGETALIWAARQGHIEAVELLLKYGANFTLTSVSAALGEPAPIPDSSSAAQGLHERAQIGFVRGQPFGKQACMDLLERIFVGWTPDIRETLLRYSTVSKFLWTIGATSLQLTGMMLDSKAAAELQSLLDAVVASIQEKDQGTKVLDVGSRLIAAVKRFQQLDTQCNGFVRFEELKRQLPGLARVSDSQSQAGCGMSFHSFYEKVLQDPALAFAETGSEFADKLQRTLREDAINALREVTKLEQSGGITNLRIALQKLRTISTFHMDVSEEADLLQRMQKLEARIESRETKLKHSTQPDLSSGPPDQGEQCQTKRKQWKPIALVLAIKEYEALDSFNSIKPRARKIHSAANNGHAFAAKLKKISGAQVIQLTNGDEKLSKDRILETVGAMCLKIREDPENTIAVFGFFGHTMQAYHGGKEHNYLAPQDLFGRVLKEKDGNENELRRNLHNFAVSLRDVLRKIGQEHPRAIWAMLDCSHDPSHDAAGLVLRHGMAPLSHDCPERTLIMMNSTVEKTGVARTADARTSFTKAVLDRIDDCRVGVQTLQQMAEGAKEYVSASTQSQELPAVVTRASEFLYLGGEDSAESTNLGTVIEPELRAKFMGVFDGTLEEAQSLLMPTGSLTSLIGPPNESTEFEQAIEDEHCSVPEHNSHGDLQFGASTYELVTPHYGVNFTPQKEYKFVVDPKFTEPMNKGFAIETKEKLGFRQKICVEDLLDDAVDRIRASHGRIGWKKDKITGAAFHELRISKVEIISLRLFTGPCYMLYNGVLRGMASGGYIQSGFPEKLIGASVAKTFVTTIHMIQSGLVKLSRITPVRTVYYGLGGVKLPRSFDHANVRDSKAGVEFGFVSASLSQERIVRLCTRSINAPCTIFEIQTGVAISGAYLGWLSQYPEEQEMAFLPLTGFEMFSSRRSSNNMLRVQVGLSSCMRSMTIEEVMAVRKNHALSLASDLLSKLEEVNVPVQISQHFLRLDQALQDTSNIFFQDDALYKLAITGCFDLKSVLDHAAVAVKAFQNCVPDTSDSNVEQLITNLLCDDVSKLVQIGDQNVNGDNLNAFKSIAENVYVNLVNRAHSYRSGADQFGSLDAYSKGRLTPLSLELQQFRRSEHHFAPEKDSDVLMTLLELGLGKSLTNLTKLEESALATVFKVCKTARDDCKESLYATDVSTLPADSALASVLSSLLAQTPVQAVGAIKIAQLQENRMSGINLIGLKLTPCEAAIVAHYFSDDSNRLCSIVVTTALTITPENCAAKTMDLASKSLGPAECVLVAALMSSRSAVSVKALILSQNDIAREHESSDEAQLRGLVWLGRQVLTQSTIEVLELTHCHLGAKAVEMLHSYTNWSRSSLCMLNLMNNDIGTSGAVMDHLKAMMQNNKQLRTLCGFSEDVICADLSNQALGPSDLMLIAIEIPFHRATCNLSTLILRHNPLTGADLWDTKFGNPVWYKCDAAVEGMRHLANAIMAAKSLTSVDISNCGIGTRSISLFAETLCWGEVQLQLLDVSGHLVFPRATNSALYLKQRLFRCRLIRSFRAARTWNIPMTKIRVAGRACCTVLTPAAR
eukprot:SAG31_NODE_157_length_22047_cov_5.897849_6_plen_1697_part_00